MKTVLTRLFILITFFHLWGAQPVSAQNKKRGTESKGSTARLREAEFFFTEAQKFFMLEDYAKSLLYFERVAELNPTNATVHYKIAEILAKGSKEEDLIKASQSIEKSLELEKKNKYFYLLASNVYGGLAQFGKAAQVMETMMKEVPGTEEYLYELAALYLYDKKDEKALDVYNRAEALLGITETSSLQKQRIYLEKRNITEALKEGEKLLQAFPDEERFVIGFAETLSIYGERAKAIPYLEKYLNTNPEASATKMLLAGLYKDDGQDEKSKKLTLEVFADPQTDVSSKVIMMGVYNAMLAQSKSTKNTNESLELFVKSLFEKLVDQHPSDPNVRLAGGELYMNLEKEEEARKQFLKAVRLGSGSFEAWQNLLYLEIRGQEVDSLIAHSEEALELFPNQGMFYYFNGYGHLVKKNFREAAQALEQAKKLSTSNPQFVSELNGMLGDAYHGAKNYQKSDQAYEASLTHNPNNDIVLNNYSYYLALRKENLERAEKMSSQLIKNFPDNASYIDTHAWVLFARGKYKEARRVIEKVISGGNATATHLEHYGDILFQLGEIDLAVAQWQKAKQQNGGNAQLEKKITNRKLY